MIVVAFHWKETLPILFGDSTPVLIAINISHFGSVGVDVFFILSGAVIAKSSTNKPWNIFARNRFLRLFPSFLVAVFTALIFVPLTHPDVSRLDHIFELFGVGVVQGNPPLVASAWTLAYEVRFYVLVALVILFTRKITTNRIVPYASAFLLFIIATPLFDFQPFGVIALSPFGVYFAFGAILGATNTWTDLKRNSIQLVLGLVLSVQVMMPTILDAMNEKNSLISLLISSSLVLLVSAVIVSASMGRFSEIRNVHLAKSITILALMTYPIYLLHETVGLTFMTILTNSGITAQVSGFIALFVVFFISWAVVRYFDPFCKTAFKKYLSW